MSKVLGGFMTTAYGPPWGGIEGGQSGASSSPTASGYTLYTGKQVAAVAVDPSLIPYGTKLRIPNNPFHDPNIIFTAVDTGGAIKGKHIDFFVATPHKANNWFQGGGQTVEIVGHGSAHDVAVIGKQAKSAASAAAHATRLVGGKPAVAATDPVTKVDTAGAILDSLLGAHTNPASGKLPSLSSRGLLGSTIGRISTGAYTTVTPGTPGSAAVPGHAVASAPTSAAPAAGYKGYVNPAPAGVSADFTGRIDQGKDATIAQGHSVLAIGNAKITNIQTGVQGFGTVVYYKLLDGPYKGRVVFQGHAGKPLVSVGQRVRAGQPIQVSYGNEGGAGHIEIGWGSADSTGTLARALGHVDPSTHHSPEGESIAALIAKLPRVRPRR